MGLTISLPGGKYANITTATSTQVNTGAGLLKRIVVNGGTLSGTITIIDGTDDADTVIATLGASQVQGHIEFGCDFNSGLRIITSEAVDITVIYQV